ncbi:MAG: YbaN family protein [Anaerolineae bacterium]|nr:YbaN family protein [Anaerolineae bacterium]
MKGLTRTLLIVGGTLCVALGVLGMFVPVLPTTPFLLLAAACYARSSKRFYHWLMTNRWWGEYIRNYREGRGIPLKQKVLTMLLLWLTIGYTAWFVVSPWWGKFILLGIVVGVMLHLIRLKTFRPESQNPGLLGGHCPPEEPA